MWRDYARSGSSHSPGGTVREIVKEAAETPPTTTEDEEEEKVFVALDKDVKEGKNNLAWVLENTSKEKKIVILHVHIPAQKIPMMGAWFPVNQLREEHVAAHRRLEKEQLEECLKEYIDMIATVKVRRAEKIVIEMDDVGKGLVQLVAQHKITKLVMGAAADKHYSRKMKAPKSKAALTVQQKSDSSCKVWFVCKGKLICTRDACLDASVIPRPSVSSESSSPDLRSRSLALSNSSSLALSPPNEFLNHRSKSVSAIISSALMPSIYPGKGLVGTPTSNNRESSVIDYTFGHREYREAINSTSLLPTVINADNVEGSPDLLSVCFPEKEDDDDIHQKLQNALLEAQKLKHEAYEEYSRRKKAEQDLNDAVRKVKIVENLFAKETKHRKVIEEKLAKENIEKEELKLHHEVIYKELKKVQELNGLLEHKISDSDDTVEDLKRKLEEAHFVIDSIQKDYEVLQRQHENVVRENERLHQNNERTRSSSSTILFFSEFSFSELEKATDNFHENFKIGEGGYGTVYKGLLGKTTVAIKMLNPQGRQGKLEFRQEIEVLSTIRHPNIVNLIGACPEASALIYEYLPNGSLEDRFACKDNTQPLKWYERVRIAFEICSALIFLHSCKPCSIVHGDLKPANILLDSNLVSKLSDFGISHLLTPTINTTTPSYCTEHPRGTLAYMDPEYFSTGEITARSDVYSFGVILLQLLTGKPAVGLNKLVKEALSNHCIDRITDASAGGWPYMQNEQLAKLGLQCCEINRKNRPQAMQVLTVLEPLVRAASSVRHSSPVRSGRDDTLRSPSYFVCPVHQELVKEPHRAADMFAYETEYIEEVNHEIEPHSSDLK